MEKKPKQVVREVPKSTDVIEDEVAEEKSVAKSNPKKPQTKKSTRRYLNKDSNWQRVDESFGGSEVTDFTMKHCTVQLQHPDQPDYIWLDLDPTVTKKTEDDGFEQAIQVAIATKAVLDKHKLKAFVKTSGKIGLHIYIPCSGFSFERTRIIANNLADEIHQLVPDIGTRSETINHRKGKVYIDANLNDYGDTMAAPYSIRPYHLPLVSTPLDWKEVKPGLDRYKFTMEEILKRIKKKGELFHDLNDEKITIQNGTIMRALI
ncbi:hypothetical protein [Sphingobacterium sp. DR205]|uniref:non-homologous end-joining DNA ligase LigD n=1 Tax=Sphingobacterium sp. DR205 TaxID=2713573 RepID=UPI0013E4B3D9|nr:hypothetical protein [Sphingobacterium sp. DR205]QIH34173.1 hypothetical protein G6053_15320 [Sphingobacterium sp. DR205]